MKPSIAVLVDGDQLGPEGMPALMQRLEKTWTVTQRYCVRNWRSTRDQQAWREFSDTHSFRLIQRDPVATGKNASDIELAVIAMDLLHAGHRGFCLVSGDMDFTPLVARLRRGGCEVEWLRPADLPSRTAPQRVARGARRSAAGQASRGSQAGAVSGGGQRPVGAPRQGSRPAKKQAPATPKPAASRAPSRGGPPAAKAAAPDAKGFARAVRRIVEDLRRAGEHEQGWVSVNRLGSKLTEAGATKETFDFPKRRPLWAALEEAGFQIEQMETGQYRLTMGKS